MIVVHVTHEAVEKIGGIGAVIAGLVTSDSYDEEVSRTILVGPLLTTDRPVNMRLGKGGHVIYSSLDGIHTPPYRERFRPIEKTYDVGIIYGTRKVAEPCSGRETDVEVLLLDVFHSNWARLNLFKAELWKKFAVPSDRFESIWEYDEYVRIAEPGLEALKAIGAGGEENGKPTEPLVILAHEYMGMPLALKAVLDGSTNTRTVFYAHEVASVRPIVEKEPGHDTMFYNLLGQAGEAGKTLEEVFPQVLDNYKHPLVKAARYCDCVFAVGDYVEKEMRFIDRHFKTMEIDLVYNGIPSIDVSLDERKKSRGRLQQYAENLFGTRPTWVFSHVARPVLSKAIWRDLRVLHELEPLLAERGESAVYFMLGTLGGQRRPQDILHMEQVYGWPVQHEYGYPDLCGGEETVGDLVEPFNREHQAVRAVFVNQWDWNQKVCGRRMPADMSFADIRTGLDAEFGMSVYEPYGISQFEALSFGAICVPSNVCGCMGFARRAGGEQGVEPNIIEANFLGSHLEDLGLDQLKNLPAEARDEIEQVEARRVARCLAEWLPRDDKSMQRMMDRGRELAGKMSWDCVVDDYFMPALERAAEGETEQ
jgi:hypothetical protein